MLDSLAMFTYEKYPGSPSAYSRCTTAAIVSNKVPEATKLQVSKHSEAVEAKKFPLESLPSVL